MNFFDFWLLKLEVYSLCFAETSVQVKILFQYVIKICLQYNFSEHLLMGEYNNKTGSSIHTGVFAQ